MTHHDPNAKSLLRNHLKPESRPQAERAAAKSGANGPAAQAARPSGPIAAGAVLRRSPMAFRAGRRF